MYMHNFLTENVQLFQSKRSFFKIGSMIGLLQLFSLLHYFGVILLTIGVKKKRRFKDQVTAKFILASNLIMLVFIPLGIFHYFAGQLLLKEISSKLNFMPLLD